MTAYVSNGNGTPRVLDYIRPWIDLYKVDLKSFDDRHYRQLGGRIEPILAHDPRAARDGDLARDRHAADPRASTTRDDETRAADRVPRRRLARHPVARDGVPQGLPDERSGEHDAGDADARGGDRPRATGCATSTPATCPGASAISEHTRCHQCRALLVERYGYFIQRLPADAGRAPARTAARRSPAAGAPAFDGQITVDALPARHAAAANVVVRRNAPRIQTRSGFKTG